LIDNLPSQIKWFFDIFIYMIQGCVVCDTRLYVISKGMRHDNMCLSGGIMKVRILSLGEHQNCLQDNRTQYSTL